MSRDEKEWAYFKILEIRYYKPNLQRLVKYVAWKMWRVLNIQPTCTHWLRPEIGRSLGVTHILEGSVRKANNNVRITTQLIDAITGSHLWSETYDRELLDVFAIQDEIAVIVTDQIDQTLGIVSSTEPPQLLSDVIMRAIAQLLYSGSASMKLNHCIY